MKKIDGIHTFLWIEFMVWFILLSIIVAGVRIYRYNHYKEMRAYQIFMPDVDGLIVGSPVKFMGVQVGYINKIDIVGNEVYVKFLVTQKDTYIPKGARATVEFSGLGGSKSLEIYSPDEESLASEKLIVVNSPKRLHDSLGLLGEMFDKIDSISIRTSYFARAAGLDKPNSTNALDLKEMRKNVQAADRYVDELSTEKARINEKIQKLQRK